MFKNLVTSALIAGFVAGLIAAALQISMLVPVLLEAELYETGVLRHFGAETREQHNFEIAHDWARNGFTILAMVAIYIGFALMMVAALAFAESKGVVVTARRGILWGLGGFAAIQLFPSIGLAPELPGMLAAEVIPRQIWWASTVIATIIGLSAIVFGKNWTHWGIGLVVLAVPHIVGAPHPAIFGGTVPPELAAEFAGLSLGVGAISWACLGLLSAYFWLKQTQST